LLVYPNLCYQRLFLAGLQGRTLTAGQFSDNFSAYVMAGAGIFFARIP
jgi:hypothetical protein